MATFSHSYVYQFFLLPEYVTAYGSCNFHSVNCLLTLPSGSVVYYFGFFFNDPATTQIYPYSHTLSLHDALPIAVRGRGTGSSIHQSRRWSGYTPSYHKGDALCAPSGHGQHCLSSRFVRWHVQGVTRPDEATGRHTHGLRRLRRSLEGDIASAAVDRQLGCDLRRQGHGFGG